MRVQKHLKYVASCYKLLKKTRKENCSKLLQIEIQYGQIRKNDFLQIP